MTQKKTYHAPALTVVRFHPEKGYAGSGHLAESINMFFQDNGAEHETETFSTHGTWTQGDNDNFWN